MSETATCRPYLARFLVGPDGLDIGFGGDPIRPDAITIDKSPKCGPAICCDAAKLPLPDNSYDWIFSSHCLEDFEDATAVLKEWLRVLKPGGNLVLFLPEQETYLEHCRKHNVLPNQDHKNAYFGINFVRYCLRHCEVCHRLIYWEFPCTYNPYSFALVACKL